MRWNARFNRTSSSGREAGSTVCDGVRPPPTSLHEQIDRNDRAPGLLIVSRTHLVFDTGEKHGDSLMN